MPAIQRLIEHLAWADAQAAAALRATPDPKALELFAHVVQAELGWLDRIDGVAAGAAMWADATLDEIVERAEFAHARLRAMTERNADADALMRPVTYRTSDGREFTSTLEDILVHVALHGQHHRAQVATLVRQAGGKPPSLDYIAWARGAAAATRP